MGSGEDRPVVDQSSATEMSVSENSVAGNVTDRGLPWNHIPVGIESTHDPRLEGCCRGDEDREDREGEEETFEERHFHSEGATDSGEIRD